MPQEILDLSVNNDDGNRMIEEGSGHKKMHIAQKPHDKQDGLSRRTQRWGMWHRCMLLLLLLLHMLPLLLRITITMLGDDDVDGGMMTMGT